MNTKKTGELTEQRVIVRLLELGASVSEPVGDSDRYDLIVDTGSNLLRVQVKTGWFNSGRVVFKTESTPNRPNGNRYKYKSSDVDAFIVYSDVTDDFYYIPIEESSEGDMRLRVEEPKKNHPSINWASDYLLTENFK